MNSLSWIIYLAGIVSDLAVITFIFGCLLLCCITAIAAEENDIYEALNITKKYLIIYFIVVIINILIPDKNTIYAIAASEYGEDMINSKITNKSIKALDAWLDEQINNSEKVKK